MQSAQSKNSSFRVEQNYETHGWLKVGFFSFAYQLNHLCVLRPLALVSLTLLFYFA